jgi:hypothetical protein
MSGRPGDVELAYEILAAAAADPLIEEFDFDDLGLVERAAEDAPTRWLLAASYFFEYRARRRRDLSGTQAREVFRRSLERLSSSAVQ